MKKLNKLLILYVVNIHNVLLAWLLYIVALWIRQH